MDSLFFCLNFSWFPRIILWGGRRLFLHGKKETKKSCKIPEATKPQCRYDCVCKHLCLYVFQRIDIPSKVLVLIAERTQLAFVTVSKCCFLSFWPGVGKLGQYQLLYTGRKTCGRWDQHLFHWWERNPVSGSGWQRVRQFKPDRRRFGRYQKTADLLQHGLPGQEFQQCLRCEIFAGGRGTGIREF